MDFAVVPDNSWNHVADCFLPDLYLPPPLLTQEGNQNGARATFQLKGF